MAMRLCPANKHYFDPNLHPKCPYCQDVPEVAETCPVAAADKTQLLQTAAAEAGEANAKTQVLPAEAASPPETAAEAAFKTVILGVHQTPDSEALAKGMRSLPAVGWLVVVAGPGLGSDFRLVQGANRIGRQANLEVCLDFGASSDASVSREALAVVVFDHHKQEFFIERGNSRNLPLLNGDAIRGEPTLKAHDVIQVGETRLLFVPLCHPGLHWEGGLLDMLAREQGKRAEQAT